MPWRHPHQADGTVTYKKLEGDIVFDDVDFGYNDEKIVLHNIKLDGDQLPLALAQIGPIAGEDCLIAVRELKAG